LSPATDASHAVREAIRLAGVGLVDRGALVELVALAAVAREHLLVIGPPGTAKSEAVRRVAATLGAHTFEYLLGRFTEPHELFGPIDLQKLQTGVVETRTEGMLPEAQLAFLDEIFLGSTAILNTLLGLLAERTFRRGHTVSRVPLRVCVGASNRLPDDPALAAFADRFLLQAWVEPVPDARLEDLLEGAAALTPIAEPVSSIEHLDLLAEAAEAADTRAIHGPLAHAVRSLRKQGIALSDRRVVKIQRLAAAAAVLAGRTAPTEADLWPLVFAVPGEDAQSLARDVLRPLLDASDNEALPDAAAEASLGPAARARHVEQTARAVLDRGPDSRSDKHLDAWQLRIEGLLRAIDAGFSTDQLTPGLHDLRDELQRALNAP
jgi:MoxR-like ATPase